MDDIILQAGSPILENIGKDPKKPELLLDLNQLTETDDLVFVEHTNPQGYYRNDNKYSVA